MEYFGGHSVVCKAKAKAYNTCRAPQAATATSEALVMSQAKLA